MSKWIEITDDPATLPEIGKLVVIRAQDREFLGAKLANTRKHKCLWVCGVPDVKWDKQAQRTVVSDGFPVSPPPTHWRPI